MDAEHAQPCLQRIPPDGHCRAARQYTCTPVVLRASAGMTVGAQAVHLIAFVDFACGFVPCRQDCWRRCCAPDGNCGEARGYSCAVSHCHTAHRQPKQSGAAGICLPGCGSRTHLCGHCHRRCCQSQLGGSADAGQDCGPAAFDAAYAALARELMGKAVFIQCGSHGPGGLRRVAQPGRQCFQSSAKIQVFRDCASASCAMLSVCAAWSYDICSAASSIICSERPLLLTLSGPASSHLLAAGRQSTCSQSDRQAPHKVWPRKPNRAKAMHVPPSPQLRGMPPVACRWLPRKCWWRGVACRHQRSACWGSPQCP